VVEFFHRIPPEEACGIGGDRLVLRRAMTGIVPDIVRQRRDKTRFFPFIDLALRDREARQVRRLLERPLLAEMGLVDGPELLISYDRYCSRQITSQEGAALWFPITLEIWMREHPEIPLETT